MDGIGRERQEGIGLAMIHGVELVRVPIPRDGEPRARDFYGALLGLRELARAAEPAGGIWYALRDGRELFCGSVHEFHPNRRATLTLVVPDLEGLADALGKAGHRAEWDFSTPTPRFYCPDPFGNRLQFVPEKR